MRFQSRKSDWPDAKELDPLINTPIYGDVARRGGNETVSTVSSPPATNATSQARSRV